MSDPIASRIGEVVDLVRAAPAQHVGRDDMKPLGEVADVVSPGDFSGGAVLSAVKQNEVGAEAGFQEVRLDVGDEYCAVVIASH